ncbi:MAG: hypothetical protein WDM76_15150 [Limisphaerales bacterium]
MQNNVSSFVSKTGQNALKAAKFIVLNFVRNFGQSCSAQNGKTTMKLRFRLFKRGEFYYSEDAVTRKQHSLHTGDRMEANRLIAAKNEAINSAQFTLAIGQTYLAVTDAQILTRT